MSAEDSELDPRIKVSQIKNYEYTYFILGVINIAYFIVMDCSRWFSGTWNRLNAYHLIICKYGVFKFFKIQITHPLNNFKVHIY